MLKNRPDLTLEKLNRTCELMDMNGDDCLVTDFERLIPTLSLPDPDDCHVLAATISCRATSIVTFNLSDFPVSILSRHLIHPIHPDDFLLGLYEGNSEGFIRLI